MLRSPRASSSADSASPTPPLSAKISQLARPAGADGFPAQDPSLATGTHKATRRDYRARCAVCLRPDIQSEVPESPPPRVPLHRTAALLRLWHPSRDAAPGRQPRDDGLDDREPGSGRCASAGRVRAALFQSLPRQPRRRKPATRHRELPGEFASHRHVPQAPRAPALHLAHRRRPAAAARCSERTDHIGRRFRGVCRNNPDPKYSPRIELASPRAFRWRHPGR